MRFQWEQLHKWLANAGELPLNAGAVSTLPLLGPLSFSAALHPFASLLEGKPGVIYQDCCQFLATTITSISIDKFDTINLPN